MKNSCKGFCCTKIEHLSVKDGSKVILDDINIHLHCGELTALIGPNGAGKSTFFKSLIGVRTYSGRVIFCGHNMAETKGVKIGYVPQTLSVDKDLPVSVLDLYISGISNKPSFFKASKNKREEVVKMLKKMDAAHLLNSRISDLSGGELQRVLLGFALIPMPNILLLDEPVSGVDKVGEDKFFEILTDLRNNNDLSIFIITHDLKRVLSYADKVILLDKSILKIGNPEAVFSDDSFIKIFGRIS